MLRCPWGFCEEYFANGVVIEEARQLNFNTSLLLRLAFCTSWQLGFSQEGSGISRPKNGTKSQVVMPQKMEPAQDRMISRGVCGMST